VFTQAMIEGLVTEADGEFDVDMRTLRHPDVRDPQVSNFEAGATGVLLIDLRTNRGHGPRTSTVTFDRGTGPDPISRMTNVMSRAFGVRDSAVKTVHDEEVQAASAAAREHLPELRTEFNAGLETGELLLVKVPFKTPDDGNEYMWVEVTAWSDGKITGRLMNEPYSVPDLQAGQRVEVQDSSVFDYIRQHADGSMEGNTTAELLQRQDSGQSGN
jgi:uncharacterized protein YegJ (DUF2314 family)